MKKVMKFVLFLLVIFTATACGQKEATDIRSYSKLERISEYKEYVLAVDFKGEGTDYAIFRFVGDNNYEKKFKVSEFANVRHLIMWADDSLYVFGPTIYKYNLEDGSSTNVSVGFFDKKDSARLVDKLYGYDDEYIYYGYSRGLDGFLYYGRITLDLSNSEFVEEEEIPKNLK